VGTEWTNIAKLMPPRTARSLRGHWEKNPHRDPELAEAAESKAQLLLENTAWGRLALQRTVPAQKTQDQAGQSGGGAGRGTKRTRAAAAAAAAAADAGDEPVDMALP
jgi:hypothetical protein